MIIADPDNPWSAMLFRARSLKNRRPYDPEILRNALLERALKL